MGIKGVIKQAGARRTQKVQQYKALPSLWHYRTMARLQVRKPATWVIWAIFYSKAHKVYH